MIEFNFSFAWDVRHWATGCAVIPNIGEDRSVKCLAIRLLCFGLDVTSTKLDECES